MLSYGTVPLKLRIVFSKINSSVVGSKPFSIAIYLSLLICVRVQISSTESSFNCRCSFSFILKSVSILLKISSQGIFNIVAIFLLL